jgi:Competence protein CoiA-like family
MFSHPEESMSDDLLVLGLDLSTGRMVHVEDATKSYWRRKGYSGDQSLVCWHCNQGEDVPTSRRVPLVVRGGDPYGFVRMHFAHPPGQAPLGNHNPETMRHAAAKLLLARWASDQPGVESARTEIWTPDRLRRSDILVRFNGGQCLAIEVQLQPLTDAEWQARHNDYTLAGIHDVWLWDHGLGLRNIARDYEQGSWTLSADLRIGMPVAAGHCHHPDTCKAHELHGEHFPLCQGDCVARIWWFDPADYRLTPIGLQPPVSARRELLRQRRQARIAQVSAQQASQARIATMNARVPRPAPPSPPSPTTRPYRQVPATFTKVAASRPVTEDVIGRPWHSLTPAERLAVGAGHLGLLWHTGHRIDSRPPDVPFDQREYACGSCPWPGHRELLPGM